MARTKRKVGTPERALQLACDAIGEPDAVALTLHPTKYRDRPDRGGDWVTHCLTPERREKFDLWEIVAIFREAALIGDHDGMEAFAALCGYAIKPIDLETELRIARETASDLLRKAQEAASDYAALTSLAERPDLIARAQRMHLKVEP